MHSIDPKWTDLAVGYQSIQLLQSRLETEFGWAVQAGHKQKFRRELTGWQKKRRVFIVTAVLAPLSIITLCLAAYYYREAACVIVYWAMLVVIILVTLAAAGRNYIREVMNRPSLENVKAKPIDLEQRWWESLAPLDKAEDKDTFALLTSLDQALPGICLATRMPGLLAVSTESESRASPKVGEKDGFGLLAVGFADRQQPKTLQGEIPADWLLFSPAGLWLFQTVPWSGTIIRQEGVWKQIQTVRDKLLRKSSQEQTMQAAPDKAWLEQKNDLVRVLKERLPQQAWAERVTRGGVVFTHPKAQPDKARIQGNTAAYGSAKAWAERIRCAPAEDGFSLEIQLEILEALQERQGQQAASAKELAGQLYQAAAEELRSSITKMVS